MIDARAWMGLGLATLAAGGAAAVAVWASLAWLRARRVMDVPNARSSHARPTPRGGGLGLVPVLLAAWAASWLRAPDPALPWVLAGAAGLAAIGFLDDLNGLSRRLRFAAQLVAVALALPWVAGTGPVFQGLLPMWADLALSGFLLLAFVNFFNFMDGIDGISGVEAASVGIGFAAVVMLALPGEQAFLGLSLAAVSLAFLAFNWPPARLFLGDVGSLPLGLLTGVLCLKLAAHGAWAAAIVLPSYYLADAGLTLVDRIRRRQRIVDAHREHFYQRAARGVGAHAPVARAVALCGAGLIAAALWSLERPWAGLIAGLGITGALLVWLRAMARGSGDAP